MKAKVGFLLVVCLYVFLTSLALTCLFAIGSLQIVISFLLPPLLPAYHTSVIHVIKACAGIRTLIVEDQWLGFKTKKS